MNSRVWLHTFDGHDVLVSPEEITHIAPSGLPGCSVLHVRGMGMGVLAVVLGDPKDVAQVLGLAGSNHEDEIREQRES